MKRKILLLLIMITTLVACSPNAKMRKGNYSKLYSNNLIENGDFEIYQEKIGTTIPGWLLDMSPNEKVAIDTTRSFMGTNSLKISQPSNEVTLISEPFITNFRNIYGFKITAKSILKKVPIVLQFITFSDSGKMISKYKVTATIGTNWETQTFITDYLRPSSEMGRVFITVYPNESVILLDNISCHVIDTYEKK